MRRGIIILAAVLLNGLALLGIGSVFVFLNTGADRSSILHLDMEIQSVYRPYTLLDSMPNSGRPIDATTRKKIVRDYLNALYTRNEALRFNEPLLMRDYYTDSAFAKMERIIDLNRKAQVHVAQTTLAHQISIDFYSEDGKLAMLTDKNVELFRQVWLSDALVAESKDTMDYSIALILEDNAWRIRHILNTEPAPVELAQDTDPGGTFKTIAGIKGVNYYPQEQPWNMFGEGFDLKAVRSDFGRIRIMGLNTIRIFIPYEEFGGPDIKPGHLDQLKQVMDAAQAENIEVLLTLFDFYGDYALADWTLSFAHARSLVAALKDHPALLGWDIKNEPDLDFERRGRHQVLGWLRELSTIVNKLDTEHPVTIGWSNAEDAALMEAEVDFVSFHYYEDADRFKAVYEKLRNDVPGKPILLQEYGLSSYSGIWNLFSGSDTKQATYHSAIQEAVAELELPFLFWTLYDFPNVPEKVVGRLPWRRMPQKSYGCFDAEGKPKEVYRVIKQK